MWELDCEESWALKNWCFRTFMLEKTLESPLDCKKIHPVHATGDQYCHGALLIYYSALLKETPESSFSFVIPFSSYLQSFPAWGSFLMSQFFASGGQSIGASASVLPINIQDWFPLGLIGLISLWSKGLSSIFSSTTIWKHQFFGAQSSLWSNSHIHTWLLETP